MVENLVEGVVKLQTRLGNASVSSVVIGGLAVVVWGEPRLTRDVDIKVQLQRDQAANLLDLLRPDYKLLSDDPAQTLQRMGMLFVQNADGLRLDLLLADTPFDTQVIDRGVKIEIRPNRSIVVCTPEDLILYKLISTRPRDREDVWGIVRRQGDDLDDTYLMNWLRQFELALDDSTLVAEYKRLRSV